MLVREQSSSGSSKIRLDRGPTRSQRIGNHTFRLLVVRNEIAHVDMQGSPTPDPDTDIDGLAMWDDNGNGRITCAEAREHGIAPLHRGHPAYESTTDSDDDGVVCEKKQKRNLHIGELLNVRKTPYRC